MAQRLPQWRTDMLVDKERAKAQTPVALASLNDITDIQGNIQTLSDSVYKDINALAVAAFKDIGGLAEAVGLLPGILSTAFEGRLTTETTKISDRITVVTDALGNRLTIVETDMGSVKDRLAALERTTTDFALAVRQTFADVGWAFGNCGMAESLWQRFGPIVQSLEQRQLPT